MPRHGAARVEMLTAAIALALVASVESGPTVSQDTAPAPKVRAAHKHVPSDSPRSPSRSPTSDEHHEKRRLFFHGHHPHTPHSHHPHHPHFPHTHYPPPPPTCLSSATCSGSTGAGFNYNNAITMSGDFPMPIMGIWGRTNGVRCAR